MIMSGGLNPIKVTAIMHTSFLFTDRWEPNIQGLEELHQCGSR